MDPKEGWVPKTPGAQDAPKMVPRTPQGPRVPPPSFTVKLADSNLPF